MDTFHRVNYSMDKTLVDTMQNQTTLDLNKSQISVMKSMHIKFRPRRKRPSPV